MTELLGWLAISGGVLIVLAMFLLFLRRLLSALFFGALGVGIIVILLALYLSGRLSG